MLDEFLKVAYQTQTRERAHFELAGLMEGLPIVELRKLAEGTPIAALYGHLDKNAYLSEACGPDGAPKGFLDKFKGTPLFEQAIALEQEELQAEMADTQKRQEERTRRAAEDTLYDTRDRIRVQKRLLELELAKVESGGAPVPGADPTAQPMGPAGPRIPPPPPLGQAAPVPTAADPTKVASRRDELLKVGHAAGTAMAKTALGMGALGSLGTAAKGLMGPGGIGQKALSFAAKNPAAVGAGIGAAGGAIAGGPDHRLSGALGGAALGGAAGHMGGKVLSSQGAPVGGITAKLREATMAAPHGAMSAAPAPMRAPLRADPSVLGGPVKPGGATLTPPNPMDFSKKPGFLTGLMR